MWFFGWYFPFSWCIQTLSHWHAECPLQAWGQIHSSTHCLYLPCAMSEKRSSGGNACNEDVDGRSVRCKTTCTYFPLKKQTSLTYAKLHDPWQGFLRCILLTIALYLSSQSTANKSIPLFCIPCKNLNSTVQWRWKFKWGRVKWPNRPAAVWTRLSWRRALGLSRLYTCFGGGICSVYMNKRTCLQRNAAWLRCEQACQLWQRGSKQASY